ncbi:MAG: hypothetical protein KJT03_10530, partial [Verrucomicrobiae bacterium]|nr:hypothetical protein [Verrucomicrobiae bacterium]
MLIRFLPGFRIFCLCWLVLWGVRPGDAASENRTIDLFAYSLVRPPIVISLADLPDEFSKFAYSLFLVSPSDQPYPLNAIVGVPEADAQNWQALAERLGWTRLNEGGFQF